jgi:hypothetical protein
VITVYEVALRKVRVIWLPRKRRWVCFGSGVKEICMSHDKREGLRFGLN